MKKYVSYNLFLLSLVALTLSVSCKTWSSSRSVERPLFIGSFNIQNLGQSKASNVTVMRIVKNIVTRYDVILIQEIVTTDVTMMENLIRDLNRKTPKGIKYSMEISERLGRGTAKEQYAFLYRIDKVKPVKSMTYPDPNDEFMRPPFIVHFETPTLRDMGSMLAIGIHTQPKNATNETSSLASVYDYAVKKFKVKDAIIMGDMNAGCANVRISDWDNIELWRRTEFTWLITHDIDTTLSTNCCPYDRFVVAGENMDAAVIWDSINAFKFRDEFGLSNELALAVSDHWPIEVKLRGGTSKEAERNVKPTLCLTVKDERKTSIAAQLLNQKTVLGFVIYDDDGFVHLRSESPVSKEVMQNLLKLGSKYPELVSKEVVDTIIYKDTHGVLEDRSSYNDVEHTSFSVSLFHDKDEGSTIVHYCTATTIN